MIVPLIQKLILPLVFAGSILLSIRYFVQPYTVWVESMTPTLNRGDNVLIERFYKYRGYDFKRFDLVAVVPPYVDGKPYVHNTDIQTQVGNITGLPGIKSDPIFIRRIIALPGETVAMRRHLGVSINGKYLEEKLFTSEKPTTDMEKLSDIGANQNTQFQTGSDCQGPIVVPEDQYFLLPDHRNNFEGSNNWGCVNKDRILGRVSHKYGLFYINMIRTPKVVWGEEKVALNDKGVHALEKDEFATAIQYFNKAMQIDKDYTVARDNLSIAYNNYAIKLKDKPDAAIDKLHKALYIDPENQLTRKNLSKMLQKQGLNPNDPGIRYAMGEKAFNERRLLDALVEFREAQRLKPDNATSAKIELLETQNLFPKEHFALISK